MLHYTYARFDDVVTRRGRCNCGNTEKEVRTVRTGQVACGVGSLDSTPLICSGKYSGHTR